MTGKMRNVSSASSRSSQARIAIVPISVSELEKRRDDAV